MSNTVGNETKFRSRPNTPRETPCKLAKKCLIAANGDRVGVSARTFSQGHKLASSKARMNETEPVAVDRRHAANSSTTSALTPKGTKGFLTRPAYASAGFCLPHNAGVKR